VSRVRAALCEQCSKTCFKGQFADELLLLVSSSAFLMDSGLDGDEALLSREEFLFEQLGSRITELGEEHAKVMGDVTELKRLQRLLAFVDGDEPATAMVNLGCEFFASAELAADAKPLVHVGLGFFLEMDRKAAIDLSSKRIELLEKRAVQLLQLSAELTAEVRILSNLIANMSGFDEASKQGASRR
jgi:prefoldin alpha subunit